MQTDFSNFKNCLRIFNIGLWSTRPKYFIVFTSIFLLHNVQQKIWLSREEILFKHFRLIVQKPELPNFFPIGLLRPMLLQKLQLQISSTTFCNASSSQSFNSSIRYFLNFQEKLQAVVNEYRILVWHQNQF